MCDPVPNHDPNDYVTADGKHRIIAMHPKFTSVEELLDYSWARDLEYPQVKGYAKANGLELTDHDFFQGYSDRQAKMEEHFRTAAAVQGGILSEHF